MELGILHCWLMVVALLSSGGVTSTSYISSNPNDCHALLNFKYGFDDLTGTLDAWNSSSISGCCDWPGITCNSAGRVTSLGLGMDGTSLVNNKNTDADSSTRYLTRLPNLVSLNLTNVDLTDSFPAPILTLTSLEFLSLFQCNLSGSLPSLGSLSRLRYLDLGYNDRLSEWTLESAGICSLGQLEFLSATGTEGGALTGPISACLGTGLNHLDLATNSLSGEVPAEISRLGNLTHLDLSYNNLGGPLSRFCGLLRLCFLNLDSWMHPMTFGRPVPDCIGNNLESLSITDNGLIGPIPASLGRLSKLQNLELDWNRFTGTIPAALGNLTQLQLLTIDNSHGIPSELSGPIPSFLANLHGLRILVLGNLGLSGSIPPDLGGLHGLEYLGFTTMPGLSGIIPEQLGNLSSLLELAIISTGITGTIPQQLGNLSRLQQLDLSGNSLSGPVTDALGDLGSLELLYLGDNRLSGGIPAAISRLRSLYFLDLSGNAFTGSIPSSLGNSTSEQMDLSRNSLTGSFPVSLCNIGSVRIGDNLLEDLSPSSTPASTTKLFSLVLSNNRLSGELPFWLSRQSTIAELDLSANNISGSIPAWLMGHSQLTRSLFALNVSHNRLSSELPTIPPIAMVDLHSNRLTGPIRLHASIQAVLYLDISDNLFSGTDTSDSVSAFPIISYLSMANNGLSGAIPSFLFGDLFANVVTLDLSHNRFSGGIPSSLPPYLLELVLAHNNLSGHVPSGYSEYMRRLDLSNNGFSGSIPSEIGRLDSLQTLDLSQNQLTGHIPSDFINLSSLSAFNVSHNHLSGRIPQGDALTKFDRSSFANNGALCGYPLDSC